MIRRSTVIATAAILLSLLVHFLGLSFTSRVQPDQPAGDATTDTVTLGNAFEDFAENLSQPVAPENTPAPEPEFAETPTSKVLVASPDPQRTTSPDTGTARIVQPDTTEPSEPAAGQASQPETVEPSRADETTTADVTVTPRVVTASIAQVPKGSPEARVEPIEATTAEPILRSPVAPAPQRLAALPVPITPALPAPPAPAPSPVPVIPLERETVAPVPPETAVGPTPEDPEIETTKDGSGGSDLAVVTSLRPPISPRRPSTEPTGLPDGLAKFSELQFPPRMESPLTVYQRDGIDLFAQQSRNARSDGRGTRGSGNADVTNYAGQVLIHLNRAPVARLSTQGSARVLFEINADGTLARVDILDSTGSREIERAAKEQVRNAAPFPPPPPGANRRLSFVYQSN
jgi:periplasmic protein TonB